MSMVREGEKLHKIVLLGPRGVATSVLERARQQWHAEAWQREDGVGLPGEPVMDFAMFTLSAGSHRLPQRVYFFGHGIGAGDFKILGPKTHGAIFKGADYAVLLLDVANINEANRYLDRMSNNVPQDVIVILHDTQRNGSRLMDVSTLIMTLDGAVDWLRALVDRLCGSGCG